MNIFLQIQKNALTYLLTYRANVFFNFTIGMGWSLISIAIVLLLFVHTETFNGWGKVDMILLLFTFTFSTEIGSTISNYIRELESNIRLGQFDGIITKPVDSQFLSIFLRPDWSGFIFLTANVIPQIYLLLHYRIDITWQYLPLYLLIVVCGNALWVSLKIILLTFNFWHQRLDNLNELLNSIFEIGKYPITIFPKAFQVIFLTILPIAFMATIPADILRGNITWHHILLVIVITSFFILLSRLLWLKAIRSYTSASS